MHPIRHAAVLIPSSITLTLIARADMSVEAIRYKASRSPLAWQAEDFVPQDPACFWLQDTVIVTTAVELAFLAQVVVMAKKTALVLCVESPDLVRGRYIHVYVGALTLVVERCAPVRVNLW